MEITSEAKMRAANLKMQAVVNRRYAEANEKTFTRTRGRMGSLYMAGLHRACAEKKEIQAEALETGQLISVKATRGD